MKHKAIKTLKIIGLSSAAWFSTHLAAMDNGGNISRHEAASIAQSQYPDGRVVSISDQSGIYRIKVLEGGYMRIIYINSETGDVE